MNVFIALKGIYFFSSPEPKAHKVSLKDGTRAGVRELVRACVRACVSACVRPHFQT